MKYIELMEALTGIGLLHSLCIFFGTLAYILDKFLEQYNKGLSEGKKVSFKEFASEPPTYIGAILTIILAYMSSIFLVYEVPDKPLFTAGLSGGLAFGGYAFLRQRMKSYNYKQQYKSQNSTGLEDGPTNETTSDGNEQQNQ